MILDEIVQKTREEVERRKARTPIVVLEEELYFETAIVSLKEYLCRKGSSGVIAELKRASPSAGVLRPSLDVEAVSIGYMQAGAAGLSVLTEPHFFKGSLDDLRCVRSFNFCPLLRKDFIIDEYQLYEAKAAGADVVLLIRRILTNEELRQLSRKAHDLGLEVLLEVHNEEECDILDSIDIDVLGVNNRNLDTLETDVNTSLALIEKLPKNVVAISESGIASADTMHQLSKAGYQGFLIGEAFLNHARPDEACRRLIDSFHRLQGAC